MTQNSFVPASVILQRLHDQAPTSPVTLRWLMDRLGQQSFGMLMLIFGIVATIPGFSLLAGLLSLVTSSQMMLGYPEPRFPRWMITRELPTRYVGAVMQRAIPILSRLETVIYPRLPTPSKTTKRLVGFVIFVVTVRLLLSPLPLSNILPAVLIAFISLAYLEQDGLLLIVGPMVGCLFLIVDLGAIWNLTHYAKRIMGFI